MKWEDYHVIWNTQSENSSQSMPVGGGSVGGNVWVEKEQIFLYLQQSGWFDENNSMLKAGRIRIKVDPCPFENRFYQELVLEDGYVKISGEQFFMNIWVDVKNPVVFLEYKSEIPRKIILEYENWRYEDRQIDNCSYELFQCKEMYFYPHGKPVFHKDTMIAEKDRIFFYHKNDNNDLSIYKELEDQGLEEMAGEIFNPQKDLVFGGIIVGDQLEFTQEICGKYQDTAYKGLRYETQDGISEGKIYVVLNSVKSNDSEQLKAALETILEQTKDKVDQIRCFNREWWNEYFSKSFITGNPEQKEYFDVMRNYQLFRYMLGCNYYGYWPTKFNGGLFTFDPSLGGKSPWSDDKLQYTPDYRLWGGGSHTIQNQRLVYWPMLKAGDSEVMHQHFDFFNRTLPVSKYRCEKNFGIEGAMYPEQVGTYGLCCSCDNEWGNKSGLPVAQIKYNFSNSLETVLMILEYYRFTGNDISEYISLMENIVLFYHHFYNKNDGHGKMIMYPANALETFHVVKNPVDGIAGLKTVIDRMLALPETLFSADKKQVFSEIRKRIPDIKTREKDGHTIIAYADTKSLLHNCEIPELYPVFPYGQFGLGKERLELAIETAKYAWQSEEQLTHISWHPTGIQYARLGMIEECEQFLFRKMGKSEFRFPAFWGPGHDWTPDHNWGGSGMIQLQEMVLQTEGNELRILPCWNSQTDVSFRLFAPDHTIVECDYRDGKIRKLNIIPEQRRKDVILPDWLTEKEIGE